MISRDPVLSQVITLNQSTSLILQCKLMYFSVLVYYLLKCISYKGVRSIRVFLILSISHIAHMFCQVKLWNTTSGFCFVTFTEHTSAVTAVTFNHTGQVVVSASGDGTVRAFDMHR